MSWDIYGNDLERGHCEVHPHVGEEYPCSICLEDSKREMAYQQHCDEMQRAYRIESLHNVDGGGI